MWSSEIAVRARAATVNRARRGDAQVRLTRVNQGMTGIHRASLAVRAAQEVPDHLEAPEVQVLEVRVARVPPAVPVSLANQAGAMTANELS